MSRDESALLARAVVDVAFVVGILVGMLVLGYGLDAGWNMLTGFGAAGVAGLAAFGVACLVGVEVAGRWGRS